MDEEITIINEKTRNEKIKSFFIENKKILSSLVSLLIIVILGFYSYQAYKDGHKKRVSEKYHSSVIEYNSGNKTFVIQSLKDIIKDKDNTYSPLALYFLIDNNLIENENEANQLFDFVINRTSLKPEIKNLIIYKKALYFADSISENELLNILKPIINSKSVWKSHGLYLMAEYFYSKEEKEKSKEFFNKILNIDNANQDIIKEAQKRLNRDLSE